MKRTNRRENTWALAFMARQEKAGDSCDIFVVEYKE